MEINLPSFNSPADKEFGPVIARIHDACLTLSVSYSLHFMESSNQWVFIVSSPAPSEETITRDHSLSIACECVLEHLEKLRSPTGN